jgi:hypothetical protein
MKADVIKNHVNDEDLVNNNNKRNISIQNDNCESCNQQIIFDSINNNNNKMYICEKCNKKFCINCRVILKENSVEAEKYKILCKSCCEENKNKKPSLLAAKQEIVNALINKANQNTVTTTTYKPTKLIKVSNCDEYYPNTENIPYIHHYHHHNRRKNISSLPDYQNDERLNSIISNSTDLPIGFSNTNFNHIDDETSFITYAEKEIANLERNIQLQNNQLVNGVTNRIHIKELQDSHLVNSIDNDSDMDLNEVIVYNEDAANGGNDEMIKRIVSSSKFSDEFNRMSEDRNKIKVRVRDINP